MTKHYPLSWSDVDVQAFRAGGKGGQHQNKTSTGIRLIHRATGLRVEARNERSQGANKKEAFSLLQGKLDRMLENREVAVKKSVYEAKPEPSFGAQIRTVRLVGKDQGVLDHRTGIFHQNPSTYLRGDLDRFLARGV